MPPPDPQLQQEQQRLTSLTSQWLIAREQAETLKQAQQRQLGRVEMLTEILSQQAPDPE